MVICGGGAIGAAIAYFISQRGAQPIVIERHEVAGAAIRQIGRLSGTRLVRRQRARSSQGSAQYSHKPPRLGGGLERSTSFNSNVSCDPENDR
jgi:glycine/D-amino acid oxidase-like deaminating enzyme